jgi:hypothetical protein
VGHAITIGTMPRSPLAAHAATPSELQDRLEADRRGVPYLLLRDGDDRQRILALPETGERVAVGRDPATDLALTWDREVSRAHAHLERVGPLWAIVDDGLSRNGSFVNGERVRGRRRLNDGDELRFGDTLVAFRAPLPASDTTALATQPAEPPRITDAQRRVLMALCRPFLEGNAFATPPSNRQIADELCLSAPAVKTHVRALFERLEVEDLPQNRKRARLVELAFARGVVGEDEPR